MTATAALPQRTGPGQDPDATETSRSPGSRIRQGVYWLVLLFFTVIFLYPFLWLLSASLKPRAEVFDNRLIPMSPTLSNFGRIWEVTPLLTWLRNSATIGLLAAASVTVSSALVAFGFAYFRFRFKNVLFGLVLATMMLPGMVTMIPVFLIWKNVGAVPGQIPLWAQNLTGSSFYIFLLRQFFLGLPRELFEAARVDGCSYFGLFTRIAAPLSKPALIIVFIFEFQASWDDVLKPLIYLGNKVDKFTVPIGLNSLFVKYNPIAGGEGDFQYIVTAALLATIPLILLFLLGQRFFIEGIANQGRKG